MLINGNKSKKIIFLIAVASMLSAYNSSPVYAVNTNDTYKSNTLIKSNEELEEELGKGLSIGAKDIVINLENGFSINFYKINNQGLSSLISRAKYKSSNDYYVNELNKYSFSGRGDLVTFKFDYLETADQTDKVDNKVKEILREIIKPGMTEDEKVKEIHDYIVTHVQYDVNGLRVGNEAHTAYAALFEDKTGEKNETVCQGYALLFYKMAKEAGLEARIMTGKSFSNSANQPEQPHAWNLVKVNGNWYQIDLTWDDPVMNPPKADYKRYNYYNLSDEEMKKDHKYDDPQMFPSCNTKYEEVATNKIILKEIGRSSSLLKANDKAELEEILLREIEKEKAEIVIKYPKKEEIQEVMSKIINQCGLIEPTSWSYGESEGGYIFTIPIKLSDKVQDIKISKYNYDLNLNCEDNINILASYANGKEKDVTSNVEFLSNDTSIVSIDKTNGKIVGNKIGHALIKVIYSGIEKELNIKVSPSETKENEAEKAKLESEQKAKEAQEKAKLESEQKAKEEQKSKDKKRTSQGQSVKENNKKRTEIKKVKFDKENSNNAKTKKEEILKSISNFKKNKEHLKEISNKLLQGDKVEVWGSSDKKTLVDHKFSIKFNKNISGTDLASKIVLFNKNTGEKIDITFEGVDNKDCLIINKKENFKEGQEYLLFISDDIKDDTNSLKLNKCIIVEIKC